MNRRAVALAGSTAAAADARPLPAYNVASQRASLAGTRQLAAHLSRKAASV